MCAVPRSARSRPRRLAKCLIVEPRRDADGARLVHERRIVVEVDAALQIVLAGDVPAEQGDLPDAVDRAIADTQAALDLAVGDELRDS